MKPSIIVWDLETVTDLAGFAAANDLVGKRDADIRAALGNQFPKHIYHSIICIGALIAHWEPDHWAGDAVGAPRVGERTEKELIASFCDKIAELTPQLVTFNGNTFDLAAGTATYKLSAIYAWTVGDDLDLFVKHQVADVSNTNQAYQDNLGVIKAVIAKYPEFKNAFTGVEAFAVDPNGRNYGTLLAMKDIK